MQTEEPRKAEGISGSTNWTEGFLLLPSLLLSFPLFKEGELVGRRSPQLGRPSPFYAPTHFPERGGEEEEGDVTRYKTRARFCGGQDTNHPACLWWFNKCGKYALELIR